MSLTRLQLINFVVATSVAVVPLHAEERTAAPVVSSAKTPLHFIIDYLPAAIYDHDGITATFRIENTSEAAIKVDFVTSSIDSAGTASTEKVESLAAAPKVFTTCQLAQTAKDKSSLKFVLKRSGEVVAQHIVRLLRDDDIWPATKVQNGRLIASDSGEILVPAVTRRNKSKDRAFAPMKWLLGSERPAPGAAKSAKALFLVPEAWPLQNIPADATLAVLAEADPALAPPLLGAADQIFQKLGTISKPAGALALDQQLVVVLPAGDLDTAADPYTYRIILDAVLARATLMRFKKVFVVAPFHYGAKEKQYLALSHEVREAAAVYGATAVDPADYLNEQLWRVDAEEAGIYGKSPNAAGLKKIEQGLWNLVR